MGCISSHLELRRPRKAMLIDDDTRSILLDKLHFSSSNVQRLEKDKELLSRTLGLIELIKRKGRDKEMKPFIHTRLKTIKRDLNRVPVQHAALLRKARADYYTFLT